MNKKLLLMLTIASGIAAGMYAAKKDPVVMRVAGRDVPRSEFEYLYHKNANQQIEPQSLEQYAEMFKLYKMKVADALAEGMDTTKSFRDEFRGYQRELATPYGVDSVYLRKLTHEAYDRAHEEREAIHIMIQKQHPLAPPVDVHGKADSLLNLLRNGADFAQLAAENSSDRQSALNGGSMGFVKAGQLPYSFETAMYSLEPGQLSDVVETQFGYHILKGGKRRPARGTVLALHLLRTVERDAPSTEQTEVKALIDSLYNAAIQPGASFEALAAKYSQDPGSARQGGKLPWFGSGQMVPEFDSVAFAMPVGEISKPVRTPYGWHIIKKLDAKGLPTYEQMEPELIALTGRTADERGGMLSQHFVDGLKPRYKFKNNDKLQKQLTAYCAEHGMNLDSLAAAFAPQLQETFFSFAGQNFTLADFLQNCGHYKLDSFKSSGKSQLNRMRELFEQQELYKYFYTHLEEENEEYRNLLNEYRDGMLLFEVSNRKVWDKASRDTEGLKQYFEQNRADYTWSEPRVKGIFVQAPNEEVAAAVRTRIAQLPADSVVSTIKAEFPKEVRIDRVLMAKGDNPLVDALVFGGAMVENPQSKFPVYFLENYKILSAPEEVDDVRGQVTSDYQNYLERIWVQELQTKYPVEVFEKELKKVK